MEPHEPELALEPLVGAVFRCSSEVAGAIARRAAERSYPSGAAILRQGDIAGETYLLVVGLAHGVTFSADGQLILLQEFSPGDLFGSLAEAAVQPSAVEIVAILHVRAAVFAALDFASLAERHACVGMALSRMLLQRLRDTTERMVERTTLSATGRVYAELLRLARAGDGRTIRPAPVLATLAMRVQSTRETVSRTVNALERRGLVRRTPDALVITAPARLEEMIA